MIFIELSLSWTQNSLKSMLLSPISDNNRYHTTQFRLGCEYITARNDGGLSIQQHDGDRFRMFGGKKALPVLSIEVVTIDSPS